jgi:DNA invertase Pin-like site-specific DNA recombinase
VTTLTQPDDGISRIVVVYERVSTDKQDIARQEAQRSWARAAHPDLKIVPIQDDGVSAFKIPIFDRQGGRHLCELVASGRVEAIFTDAVDRLSRGEDLEWVTFRALCETAGTRLVIDGQELRTDLGGKLEGYLKALLARQESVEKSHRVRSGKAFAARQGRHNGGPRKFGYRFGPPRPKGEPPAPLEPEPHEFEALRRMRVEVIAGRSRSKIAMDLNRDGVRTATGVPWSDARVSQVLRNPLYVGKRLYKGELIDGNWPPVFTETEWVELQAALDAASGGRGKGGRTPQFHLLARGMLRCGCCGASVIPRRTTNTQGRVYEMYRCLGRMSGASPDCTMPSLHRAVIDGALIDYFGESCLDIEATRRRVSEQIDGALTQTRAALGAAERQRAIAEDRLARIKRDYQDGSLEAADWQEQRDELRGERDAADAEVARLTHRADDIEAQGAAIDAEDEVLRHLIDLRAAASGTVSDATGIEGVRAALLRLFSGFTLHSFDAPEVSPALPDGWLRSDLYVHPKLLLAGRGGFVIEPHPRAEAVLSGNPSVAFPELRRVALDTRVQTSQSSR